MLEKIKCKSACKPNRRRGQFEEEVVACERKFGRYNYHLRASLKCSHSYCAILTFLHLVLSLHWDCYHRKSTRFRLQTAWNLKPCSQMLASKSNKCAHLFGHSSREEERSSGFPWAALWVSRQAPSQSPCWEYDRPHPIPDTSDSSARIPSSSSNGPEVDPESLKFTVYCVWSSLKILGNVRWRGNLWR